jgi:hypothetical protein
MEATSPEAAAACSGPWGVGAGGAALGEGASLAVAAAVAVALGALPPLRERGFLEAREGALSAQAAQRRKVSNRMVAAQQVWDKMWGS